MRAAFDALHRRRFGFSDPARAVTLDAIVTDAIGHAGSHAGGDETGPSADADGKPLADAQPVARPPPHAGELPVISRAALPALAARSDERRVGKGGVSTCRSGGAAYHS